MATYATIRRADSEDTDRLLAAARRFAANHPYAAGNVADLADGELSDHPDAYVSLLEMSIVDYDASVPGARNLLPRWRAAARRALRHPRADTIAWGYVGYNVR